MPLSVNQLVGFGAKRTAAAAFTGTMTYQDVTQNNASATITIPAGAAEDGTNVVFLFDTAYNASVAPTYVLPTGFSAIGNNLFSPGTHVRCVVSYKILTSGDASASVTGMNDTYVTKHLVRYSCSEAMSSITIYDLEEYGSNADPGSFTINSASGATPLIAMGYASANATPSVTTSWTPDFSSTETALSTILISTVQALAMNSSPSDVTWNPADVGVRNLSTSFYAGVA